MQGQLSLALLRVSINLHLSNADGWALHSQGARDEHVKSQSSVRYNLNNGPKLDKLKYKIISSGDDAQEVDFSFHFVSVSTKDTDTREQKSHNSRTAAPGTHQLVQQFYILGITLVLHSCWWPNILLDNTWCPVRFRCAQESTPSTSTEENYPKHTSDQQKGRQEGLPRGGDSGLC